MQATEDWIEIAREPETGIEVIRARFGGHAYDPHAHDEYLIGVTEAGVQGFNCRRVAHRSTPGTAILMEPGERHDGHAAAEPGFTYRMLYLPAGWLRLRLSDLLETPAAWPEFRRTLSDAPGLGTAVLAAHAALRDKGPRMLRDAALDRLVLSIRTDLVHRPALPAAARAPRAASRARAALEARMAEDIGIDDLAAETGMSRFRLSRAFKAAYGLAPHAYLIELRLRAARRLLAQGSPPAEVASAVGFADQSHLGRWFRRAFRLTPAVYRQLCTNVPDGRARTA